MKKTREWVMAVVVKKWRTFEDDSSNPFVFQSRAAIEEQTHEALRLSPKHSNHITK